MARHRPSAGRVKIHRNYTIADVATLFSVHRNTVRRWISQGLPILQERKPHLILGQHLSDFLRAKRSKRVKLQPGELYCVKCHLPQRPALGMADYVPITGVSGNLRGLCPVCETLMHRRTALRSVAANAGDLDVTIMEGSPRIAERRSRSTNDHFKE